MLSIVAAFTFFGLEPLIGEWVAYPKSAPQLETYQYLRLKADGSGRYVHVHEGKTYFDETFESSETEVKDGFIEVQTKFKDAEAVILFSGWKSEEDGNFGLLTGVIFLYHREEGRLKPFNTFFLRLEAVTERDTASERRRRKIVDGILDAH